MQHEFTCRRCGKVFTREHPRNSNGKPYTFCSRSCHFPRSASQVREDGSVLVPLSGGQHTVIDGDDAPRVLRHRWYLNLGYARTRIQRTSVYLHAFVLDMECPEGQVIDHINRDKLDNRRGNLRCLPLLDNVRYNAPVLIATNTSGYRGVYWERRRGNWHAQIRIDGKIKWLGNFDSVVEAARMYDHWAKIAHGEKALLNFPDE